jgi:hypothetical protein
MQLYLGEFGPVRIFGRTLVILCSYRGGEGQQQFRVSSRFGRLLARIFNAITLRSLRTYVGSMRDHYANARPLPMQIQLAEAALALGGSTTVRVAADARLAADGVEKLWQGVDTEIVALARTLPELRDADTVVLVYPDALGLGFGNFESRLLAAGARNVVVVSGRRRLFPLTTTARRALRWRRALASTRLLEFAAALVLIPLAAVLSGYDRVRGRT